jgi:hypothetical protein
MSAFNEPARQMSQGTAVGRVRSQPMFGQVVEDEMDHQVGKDAAVPPLVNGRAGGPCMGHGGREKS